MSFKIVCVIFRSEWKSWLILRRERNDNSWIIDQIIERKGGARDEEVICRKCNSFFVDYTSDVLCTARAEHTENSAVSSGLAREGDFAIKLAEVLKLGTARTRLKQRTCWLQPVSHRKNGWIADYPLTPDIIGEVRTSISLALDSRKIAMKKDEASLAVQVLIDNQRKLQDSASQEQTSEYGDYLSASHEAYDPYYSPEPYYSQVTGNFFMISTQPELALAYTRKFLMEIINL